MYLWLWVLSYHPSIAIRTSNKHLDREPFNLLLRGSESSQKSNSTLTPKVQGKGRKTVSLDSILPTEPFVTFLGESASIPSGPLARTNMVEMEAGNIHLRCSKEETLEARSLNTIHPSVPADGALSTAPSWSHVGHHSQDVEAT